MRLIINNYRFINLIHSRTKSRKWKCASACIRGMQEWQKTHDTDRSLLELFHYDWNYVTMVRQVLKSSYYVVQGAYCVGVKRNTTLYIRIILIRFTY